MDIKQYFSKKSTDFDQILNISYEVFSVNAQKLSEYLKNQMADLGLDYNTFNSKSTQNFYGNPEYNGIENPPKEIYEYQNFFLLEKDAHFYLLDGFRRLLWYNTPDMNINVRVYKMEDFKSSGDLLNLMVDLNHFKFFGGSYIDRGFSLFLYLVFNIDMRLIKEAYTGYMKYKNKEYKIKYSVSKTEREEENIETKKKILNPLFVKDMQFLQLLIENNFICNGYVGRMIHMFREQSSKPIDTDLFMKYLSENQKILNPLIEKVRGKPVDGYNSKTFNSILEYYDNALKLQLGEKIEKTYEEKLLECKKLQKELQKNKNYIKITTRSSIFEYEEVIKYSVSKNLPLKITAIIFPSKDGDTLLPYGLNENLAFEIINTKSIYSPYDIKIVSNENKAIKITHKYKYERITRYISMSWGETDLKSRDWNNKKRSKTIVFINTEDYNKIKNLMKD